MTSGERKLLLIFGIGCLPIVGILLIRLWQDLELIGFLAVGLAALVVLVMLAERVIRTLTDAIVKLHEQKLRQERLRPNDNGDYEIPLDGVKIPTFPPSNTQHQEGQESYSQGYTQFHSGRWD
jgi:heme exporter protein D